MKMNFRSKSCNPCITNDALLSIEQAGISEVSAHRQHSFLRNPYISNLSMRISSGFSSNPLPSRKYGNLISYSSLFQELLTHK